MMNIFKTKFNKNGIFNFILVVLVSTLGFVLSTSSVKAAPEFTNKDSNFTIINLTNNTYVSGEFPNGYYFQYPSFNVDSTKIVVAAKNSSSGRNEIWVMDYDKHTRTISNFQQITSTAGVGDVYDNGQVLFSRTDPDLIMFLESHNTTANKVITYNLSTSTFTTIYDPSTSGELSGLDATNVSFLGHSNTQLVSGTGYNSGSDRVVIFSGTYPSFVISSDNKNLDPSSNYEGTRVTYYSSTATDTLGSVFSEYSDGVWTQNNDGFASGKKPGLWSFYSGKVDDKILSLRSGDSWTSKGIQLRQSDGTLISDILGDASSTHKSIYPNHNWEGTNNEILFRAELLTHSGYGNNIYIAVPNPDIVYVDDDYTSSSSGDYVWGYNAFNTIQAAIDTVVAGGTVNVAPGLYQERILINKNLTLLGATKDISKKSYSVPANYAYDSDIESIIKPATDADLAMIRVRAPQVTINGFVVYNDIAAGAGYRELIYMDNQVIDYTDVQILNSVVGPDTNVTSQDGTKGRSGITVAGPSASKVKLTIKGNMIFDALGNGCGIMLLGSGSSSNTSVVPGTGNGWVGKYEGSTIENNTITGNHRSGIELAGGVQGISSAHFTIKNNNITDNGYFNIADKDLLKYGNGITFMRVNSDKNYIDAKGGNYIDITNNNISGNEKNAIYTGPINANLTVENNVIQNNGIDLLDEGYSFWDGIRIDLDEAYNTTPKQTVYNALSNVNITENSIDPNGSKGINVISTPTSGLVNGISNWWGNDDGPIWNSTYTGAVTISPFCLDGDCVSTGNGTKPVVNAGSNQHSYPNREISITGTSSDSGSGVDTNVWSQESGSGTVTIGDPNSTTTTIKAANVGSYALRLTTTDKASNSDYDEIQFTVHKNGDIDNSGIVNNYDFTLLMYNWGDSPINQMTDYDQNGSVNNNDFTILMYWWND